MSEGINTNAENPEGKRCCLCFPLQYGFIKWGYLKMIVSAFFILVISYALLHTCMVMEYNGDENRWFRIYGDIAITCIALTFFLADLLLTMLFTVRVQQKRVKLLSSFYVLSVVIWAVSILLTAMAISLSIESWLSRYMSARSLVVNLMNFAAYIVIIIVQTFFLLLLRGEITQLRNNGKIKFTNNAAEPKCTLKRTNEGKEDGDTDDTEEE
ncbi:hypothetical protein PYW07_012067 [Mythimna separata]|uniref:Uncharacterized protein n=1 Tax=Mythimna separata TaxID=271217 RepID=A0AAD7YM25_MYTSE|nr:hypothetical protein PYW07_012067 [Mythimna separata]